MKPKVISRNFTGQSIVIVYVDDKGTHTKIVDSSHPNWAQVFTTYQEKRYDDIIPLLSVQSAIQSKFRGRFTVENSRVYFNGTEVGGYLVDRILFFMRFLPEQAERLIKFAENLYANPSPKVIEQLYKFLEHKNMPITDDGYFLAYKGVRADYYSITAGNIRVTRGIVKEGRIWNGVGTVVECEREDVCGDTQVGCASGLHVGSWEYANGFRGTDETSRGKLVIVKVNPKNVVSVPDDCNCQKVRTSAYEVVAEEDMRLNEVFDADFDKSKQKFLRDSLGRFVSARSPQRQPRDAQGRFLPKV